MKLRCIDSNSLNYAAGFEYHAEIGSFTKEGGEIVDVVHGAYTWFYFNKADLTATRRNGSVVAKFKIEQ